MKAKPGPWKPTRETRRRIRAERIYDLAERAFRRRLPRFQDTVKGHRLWKAKQRQ